VGRGTDTKTTQRHVDSDGQVKSSNEHRYLTMYMKPQCSRSRTEDLEVKAECCLEADVED